MDPHDPGFGSPGTSASPEGPTASEPSLWVKLLLALVIVGLLAAAYGATKAFLDEGRISDDLEERGVSTDADVVSVTEFSGRRIETYHELSVSYDPPGSKILEFADVQDCSGARYESFETVRILYLPDDPDVVRLDACRSSFDRDILPAILGGAFFAFALLLLWRSRAVWRS